MRVLQLTTSPKRRGAEVFALQLSSAIRGRGHTAHVVYLYSYEGAGALALDSDDRVLSGNYDHPFEKFLGVQPLLLRRVRKLINELEPDIVQVNGGRAVKYGAVARALERSAPWALVYRNIGDPREWITGHLRRYFYRYLVMPRVDGAIAVSETTLRELKNYYRLHVPTIHIPTAIDGTALVSGQARENLRRDMGVRADDPVLIYVGSLTAEKRVDRLIRLAARLESRWPNLHVWIVGDGPERPSLEQDAAALGVAPLVKFVGERAGVADFYVAADLLVLASDTEGIPGVVLEGGYLGLPAVVTDVGGVEECLVNGETGLLVDPNNEEEFSTAVAQLLAEPTRRQALGTRAKSWVEERFLIDRAVDSYLQFYAQILGQ